MACITKDAKKSETHAENAEKQKVGKAPCLGVSVGEAVWQRATFTEIELYYVFQQEEAERATG